MCLEELHADSGRFNKLWTQKLACARQSSWKPLMCTTQKIFPKGTSADWEFSQFLEKLNIYSTEL